VAGLPQHAAARGPSRDFAGENLAQHGGRIPPVPGWPAPRPEPADNKMTYRHTSILLPCHGLEDFPTHHEGKDADGLLAAWTALWHPVLLASTGAVPSWYRVESPPTDLEARLIVVPGVCQHLTPPGFSQLVAVARGRLITGNLRREHLLERILGPAAGAREAPSSDLVGDFLALGYAYLQVQLLTRQMRYATHLDDARLSTEAVSGARAAVAGDEQTARERLTACFDLLVQERAHYYTVNAYILDLLLAAPTTGGSLEDYLAAHVPVNLLLTGELLASVAESQPRFTEALRQAVGTGMVGLVGGQWTDDRVPLLACETVLRGFQRGLQLFDQHLQSRPRVFGRRQFGVSPLVPQLLRRLGYEGAIHAVLSQGRYPEGAQIKFRWEGPDRSALDTIGRTPLDVSQPGTFLALAKKLGATMDVDHVATLFFVHWPGGACTWYYDLRRAARYGSMLGKFVTAQQYFRDTDYPAQVERFRADQYQSPYLAQAVARRVPDPISTSVRYWRRRALCDAAGSLEMLASVVRGRPHGAASAVADDVDRAADGGVDDLLDQRLRAAVDVAAAHLADGIPRRSAAAEAGYLVMNPSSFVRREVCDVAGLETLPAVEKPIYAAASDGRHKHVVADVPPMGFAWIAGSRRARRTRAGQPLAEDGLLRNEYFEAHVDPRTGGLRAMYSYARRGNCLSQQLAIRASQARRSVPSAPYSRMVADRSDVTAQTAVFGEITTEGHLLHPRGEKVLARFRQRFRVWRGRRVLELHIQLEPVMPSGDHPWNSYYACRFAWADEGASVWRGVNQLREKAEAKRFEAPNYIDIEEGDRRVTILTGGLPYHRRVHERMLDSLLIVKGERARVFDIGIGIDLKSSAQESLAFLAPLPVVQQVAAPPAGSTSGWLFHIDSRNVVATWWAPVVVDGEVRGVRVRLLETAGRSTRATLRGFRPFLAGCRRDFVGGNLGSCSVADGALAIEMMANEWTEVEATWTATGEVL